MESWKKTFAVIWSGQLASILSSEVVAYSIIFWMSLETGSAEVLALAAIAGMLPQSLLGPLVGVYVDRWDRKRTMILADSFIALCTLALAALCMLPTQVQAASTSTTEKHMHGDVECILWTDERAREQCGPNSTASNSLPYVDYGQLGIYCLTKDVYLPEDWTPYTWWGATNSLTICLNGHTINGAGILGKDEATYNDITDQQSLTLMDCTEDASKRGSFGVYNSAGSKNSAILLKRGNNLTLSNVTLTGIDCAKAAITVGDRATLNLCDGASIEYNKSTGDKQATIVINKGGTFNMTGGQIRDNKGYAGGVLNNGTFNMTGGEIKNCETGGYGLWRHRHRQRYSEHRRHRQGLL